MTGWLLDTNIVSEIRRRRPEAKVVSAIEAQPLDQLYISVVTLAEIRFGIEQLEDFKRRTELNIWLSNKVRPMFDQRVLPITEDIMVKWRLLVEDGRKAGYTYSQPDLIIGATAIHYGLTVMSRDTSEYIRAGVPVFNPWTDRPPTPNDPV